MKISQICFPEAGKVVCEEKEIDLSVGQNDVLIRTCYSVISAGTELAKLTGLQKVEYPFIPGNRAVGEVIEVGTNVRDFAPGDHVFSHTLHVSHAKSRKLCIKIPKGIDLCHASLLGLGLVGMTPLRVGRPELGDRAVVIGMGVVGNLCAQLLKSAGIDVIAVDIVEARLETALRCGIPQVINPQNQDARSTVMEITNGHGAEYVVEATGKPAAMEIAYSVSAKQGEVILLGTPRGEYQTDVTPLLSAIHLWQHGSLQFKGAHEWRYPLYPDGYTKHSLLRNAEIFFRIMSANRLNIQDLVTHVVMPDQADAAYAGLLHDKAAYLGVIFDWTACH